MCGWFVLQSGLCQTEGGLKEASAAEKNQYGIMKTKKEETKDASVGWPTN